MQYRTERHLNLEKALESLTTDKILKVGWVDRRRYPEDQGGAYVAEVAAKHEFGVGVPQRSFMRPAINKNKQKWMKLFSQGCRKVIKGEMDIEDVLNSVGAVAAGDVSKAITRGSFQPLSQRTIEARKARYVSPGNKNKPTDLEKPLVDTKVMLRSISYAIEPE